MTSHSQTIPCPTCSTTIPFDVHQLLMGARFVCPNCQGVIALAAESRGIVKETMEKFDEMKSNVLKMKKG